MSKFMVRIRSTGKDNGKIVYPDIWSKKEAIEKATEYTEKEHKICEVISIGIIHVTEDSAVSEIVF